MKNKIICLCLVFVVILSLSTPIYAESKYNTTISCTPNLQISNLVAICKLKVIAENSSDSIVATIKLKNTNGITLKTWSNVSAYGTLSFNETYSVVANKTYELVVSVKVTGDKGTDTINKTVIASS